jgi:hypothetical protein
MRWKVRLYLYLYTPCLDVVRRFGYVEPRLGKKGADDTCAVYLDSLHPSPSRQGLDMTYSLVFMTDVASPRK